MNQGNNIVKGLFWKVLERFGVQGIQFVLQIILARLLDANDYGVLSLMVIFTTLANIFIQNGFSGALVQNKEVDDEDFSTVFWITLAGAILIYTGLFFAAPAVAKVYEMPDIVWPFRVLCTMLIPGALNSVQLAKIRRSMDFKKVFTSNIAAVGLAGIAGIVLACMGAGVWALVIQNLVNVTVACLVMWYTVKWRPKLVINLVRAKTLFAFSWKLLVSGLLDTLYQDIRSLVIGVKYDAGTLGYYNRGKQFPQFIINAVNGTVQSVMLPAMSAKQDDRAKVKMLMRKSVVLSSYIVFPVMAGLAAVATPLVRLLLTEKWLPSVPYLQIYCFSLAFYPVHSCNLQAINAVGRSDVFLKLEVIKKMLGMSLLTVAVFFFDSPIAIAMTGVLSTVINCFVNSYPNKKLIDYSYFEQMRDILPSFAAAIIMCGCVLAVGMLPLQDIVLLALQVVSGVTVYIAISAAFRLEPFLQLLRMLNNVLLQNNGKK